MGLGTPYRLNRNSNGGGLMLFVREDIPSNLVEAETKPRSLLYRIKPALCQAVAKLLLQSPRK